MDVSSGKEITSRPDSHTQAPELGSRRTRMRDVRQGRTRLLASLVAIMRWPALCDRELTVRLVAPCRAWPPLSAVVRLLATCVCSLQTMSETTRSTSSIR